MTCVICESSLPTPLETYGHLGAPMCLSCWLHQERSADPFDRPFFTYEPIGDGWYNKCLTEAGCVYLGGKLGDAILRVRFDDTRQ